MLDRLMTLRNDVGLLAEEYDIGAARLVGNFPQALSHIALVNSVHNLTEPEKPSEQRSGTPLRDKFPALTLQRRFTGARCAGAGRCR